jgi:hypothetical protein
VRSDWRARSPFIERHGSLSFHHFDLHAQALSKVERGHEQDVDDVNAMVDLKLVTPAGMWQYFTSVSHELFRYPALDAPSFERAMVAAFGPRTAFLR